MISKISAIVGVLALLVLIFATHSYAVVPSPTLLVTEIQTRPTTASAALSNERFVELYNYGEEAIDLSGIKLEYKPSIGGSWNNRLVVPQPQNVNYTILPGGYFIFATADFITAHPDVTVDLVLNNSALTSASGGHIRILLADGLVVEQIGWGENADSPLQKAAPLPSYGHSLQRCLKEDVIYMAANNYLDFGVYQPIGPRDIIECPVQEVEEGEESENGGMGSGLTCEGVAIAEILPNPAGSDASKEFIELHNPTNEVISLNGCMLQTSANAKTYAFGAIEVQPGEYAAFYDGTTGLSLPNATGGTVWLLSPTEELQAVTYLGGLADDVSWIWFDGVWQQSYFITPNAPNVLLSAKPCLVGQERNPETGTCRNIVNAATSTLMPCREGQERNPETNRCRSITTAATTLVPCRADQERSPDTNRCRSINTASTFAPCADDQERNPDTNRCRKVADVAGVNSPAVKDVYAGSLGANPKWWLVGLLLAAVVGYAVFEWRSEILGKFIKSKP